MHSLLLLRDVGQTDVAYLQGGSDAAGCTCEHFLERADSSLDTVPGGGRAHPCRQDTDDGGAGAQGFDGCQLLGAAAGVEVLFGGDLQGGILGVGQPEGVAQLDKELVEVLERLQNHPAVGRIAVLRPQRIAQRSGAEGREAAAEAFAQAPVFANIHSQVRLVGVCIPPGAEIAVRFEGFPRVGRARCDGVS